MEFENNLFISQDGLFWPEILRKDVPKSSTSLQPIFEAFTNSLEAIRDKKKLHPNFRGEINIKIHSTEATVKDTYNFSHLSIIDDGIGFNYEQFKRFNTFRDVRKNYNNMFIISTLQM
jgi:hypothetical protein